ncbi:hypothetical protein GOP47_0020397 [Adiantum capillus-veneris]|uniref:Ataxin-10 domain-containing protein n=1 Tax=Adiantum capillus-veneris TaxID=13818 RepID=A0A9D4UDF3_ADICA|nr:hypothetical protein GOP47_0020397 [Adiantum capillus-veneris]
MAEEEEAVSQLGIVLRCSSDDEETKTGALRRLIVLSRSPAVRNVLASHDAVPSLVPLIAQDTSSLLLLLNLLRNLCAGDRSNQDGFLRSNGVHFVARVVNRALDLVRMEMEAVSTLQICLQLLGNACGAGEAQRDAAWKAFFPDTFRTLALLKDESKIMEPLSMVIYTCSHGNFHRLKDLCIQDGAVVLSSCLQAVAPNRALCGSDSDWICLLTLDLCSEKSLVPLLFRSLQGPSEESIPECQFTTEQATLLSCLLDVLGEEHSHDIVQNSKIDVLAIIEFLAQILRYASHAYFTSLLTTSSAVAHATGPCGIPVIDVLGYTLELFKVLSGFDCGDQKSGSRFGRSSVVGKLLEDGVIELCIELLKKLGPPELIVRAMQRSNAHDSGHEHNGKDTQEGLQLIIGYAKDPLNATTATLPYRGYRRDLVAVIGNAAYQNRAVQDEVRHLGGLFLLLQQCVTDEANPFLREWGLWAVRNLVDNNIENSKELSELQMRGSLTPTELAEMGYKVEVDPKLGRPKLVNMPSKDG